MNNRALTWVAIAGGLALYILGLREPAVLFREFTLNGVTVGYDRSGTVVESGQAMLISSVWGLFELNFAGLANPALWIGWTLMAAGKFKSATIWLAVAALLTVQTFQLLAQDFSFDEGNVDKGRMIHPLAGFYIWVASILLSLAAAILLRRRVVRGR